MALTASPPYRLAFREWFGLSPAAADLLVALYAAKGDALHVGQLAERGGVMVGSIGFHLTSVRGALESEALDYERGRGYRLTDEGMAECRAALWTMGEELRRVS